MDSRRIVIVAVGGQGSLVTSRILGQAAIKAGVPVQISEIHGMAQRGGVVESDILLGDMKSSTISDGEADILLAFEPLEALRAMSKCNKETLVITNTAPVPPITVTTGKDIYPNIEELLKLVGSRVRELIAFDASRLAEQSGSIMALNMVILGALAQKGWIPLSDAILRETITSKTIKSFWKINLKAFNLGYQAAASLV